MKLGLIKLYRQFLFKKESFIRKYFLNLSIRKKRSPMTCKFVQITILSLRVHLNVKNRDSYCFC